MKSATCRRPNRVKNRKRRPCRQPSALRENVSSQSAQPLTWKRKWNITGLSVSRRGSLSTKLRANHCGSARSELHPLAEQAQARGRLTKAEGPEGPMAPIVTTGGYNVRKMLARHSCTVAHANLLCIVQQKNRIVRVILVPGPCNFRRIEKKKEPC